MPIRDVETYGPIGRNNLRYLANRGTNGIDGVISTALGAAAPWSCDRMILLTGDLAFLYDSSALAIASNHGLALTIVCLDNSGGGIFSFLPVAEHPQHFERLIATPQAVDVAQLGRAYGLEVSEPGDAEDLAAAVARPGLVHLRTDREANRRGHDRVASSVVSALG
jgi:2-succinyl-5-enolpyruvyl-6-hydroxy-3-cyclohexene-1-carboxylate synthase